MPILKNQRHEKFCQEIIKGKTAADAYRASVSEGRSQKALYVSASMLLSSPKVVARIAEIREKLAERFEISRGKVLEELAKIGFANARDYVGPDGKPLELFQLTRDQAAAIVEVTVSRTKRVTTTKYKLADKRGALVDLARLEGWVIERVETGQPGDFSRLSDAEVAGRIEEEGRAILVALRGEASAGRAQKAVEVDRRVN